MSTSGGCIASIMIPATLISELVNMIGEIAKNEAEGGTKLKIVHTVLGDQESATKIQPYCNT